MNPLLLVGALLVICGVALIHMFQLLIRASRADTGTGLFKNLGLAAVAMAVVLLAFEPVWGAFEQFQVNFGNSPSHRTSFPAILLLYVIWASVLLIRWKLKKPPAGAGLRP